MKRKTGKNSAGKGYSKVKEKYALISVSDKSGIITLAKVLYQTGFRIIATGGTAKLLSANDIPIIPIHEITGNTESFSGRIKTISFQIASGILFNRSNLTHIQEAKRLGIKPIDVVVCNLYPFEQTVANQHSSWEDVIESIDVGGPTMIRAAAKNCEHVTVVTDPADYEWVGEKIAQNSLSEYDKQQLASKAFFHLSFYDSQIARYLNKTVLTQLNNLRISLRNPAQSTLFQDRNIVFPDEITLPGRKIFTLRYGENPHQKAATYIIPNTPTPITSLKKQWGRDLSLTNLTDINAGIETVRLFNTPCAVVIKHNNPCGIALGENIKQALQRAIEADPESAFGGVVVLNKPITLPDAQVIASFKEKKRGNMDIIAAAEITPDALSLLSRVRKSMGIYTFGRLRTVPDDRMDLKWIDGGFILQTRDDDLEKGFRQWKVVTKQKPTAKQKLQMQLAWKFITRIKSNAVIIVDKKLPMTRGIGTGQTSRIRAVKIALLQAGEFAQGAIMASDSFFPFDDSVRLAAAHGIKAIVQQGGSINDQASINAANESGISMVFTNRRAFWH